MSDDTTKRQVDSAKKPDGKTPPAKAKKKLRKPKPMPDVARMYIEDQTRDQTPWSSSHVTGSCATVVEGGKFEHILNVDG